jgi:hypothetical protein
MITQKNVSPHAFDGQVIVNESFRYSVKITKFRITEVEPEYIVKNNGEIVGCDLRGTFVEVDWVEMKFKVVSSRSSMRNTFMVLTQACVKRLFALEAAKCAKSFVRGLKGKDGKSLRIVFIPQRMYTNDVEIHYDRVGCPLGATVRVRSQLFAEYQMSLKS